MTKVGAYVRAACKRCDGIKLPGNGQKFCAICKSVADAERKQKQRDADLRYRRRMRGAPKPRTKKVKAEKPIKVKPPKKIRIKVVKTENKVPSEIRQAWSRAHPNSAIRRKFPTPQSLKKHDWEKKAA